MNKKLFVTLSLIGLTSAFMAQAMAEPTIYTDGIGRLHFLGKDPGSAKRLDAAEANKFANPAQMEFTNTIYKGTQTAESETVTTQTVSNDSDAADKAETKVSTKRENKSKGAFTFNKGAMDASDPYTYGNTNISTPAVENKTNNKKIYTDELGREHFFGKTNK